jgi:hypothetical protein
MHAAGLLTLHRRRKADCIAPLPGARVVEQSELSISLKEHAGHSNILRDGISRLPESDWPKHVPLRWWLAVEALTEHIHSITSRNVHIIPAAPARMPAACDREPILCPDPRDWQWLLRK